MRIAWFFVIIYTIFIPAQLIFSFEWPLSRVEVATTFGEHRHGGFFKGVEIEGEGQPVKPIERGTLLFVAPEKPRHNGGLPCGLGNSMVVEHERGIRSVYGYLEDIPVRPDSWKIKSDEVLSTVGSSGSTEGNVLYLQVLDSEFAQVVNPLVSLPSPDDRAAPEVGQVRLSSAVGGVDGPPEEDEGEAEGISYVLESRSNAPAGEYELLIEAYDLSARDDFFRPMAPFSFRVFLNGEEKLNLRFEAIKTADFRHTVVNSSGVGVESFYHGKWIFRLGTLRLNPGDAMIEVVVSDFAGNESSKTFRVAVR